MEVSKRKQDDIGNVMENQRIIYIFRLSIPLFAELVLKLLVGSVNTLMLSRISDDAAASVAVSNQILNVILVFSTMIASGSMILANQAIGAKAYGERKEIVTFGFMLSMSIGVGFCLITIIFAEPLVRMIGLEDVLVEDAVQYLRIVGGTCVVQFVSAYCSVHLRCSGKFVLPMISTIGINVLNILGSFFIITGFWGIKGVMGISLIRAVSECVGGVILFIPFLRYSDDFLTFRRLNIKKHMGEIFGISTGIGIESFSYMIAKLITVTFITALPAAVLAAKTYAQMISGYNYLLGAAIAQASQIVIGQMIGAKRFDEAEWLAKKTAGIAFISNFFFSVIFLIFYRQILGVFTSSEDVISIVHQVMEIDVLIAIGRSQGHIYGHALKSAGYIVKPMMIAVLGIWGFSVGVGFILTVICKWGIVGIWTGEMLDEWIRAGLLYRLWKRKKWIMRETEIK